VICGCAVETISAAREPRRGPSENLLARSITSHVPALTKKIPPSPGREEHPRFFLNAVATLEAAPSRNELPQVLTNGAGRRSRPTVANGNLPIAELVAESKPPSRTKAAPRASPPIALRKAASWLTTTSARQSLTVRLQQFHCA